MNIVLIWSKEIVSKVGHYNVKVKKGPIFVLKRAWCGAERKWKDMLKGHDKAG